MQPQKLTPQENTYRVSDLGKENRIISQLLTANSFHLTLPASTKPIEADTVLIQLDDFAQARSQLSIAPQLIS